MLRISFQFLSGRYHATPWERHVNEGDVAWPPEPWRILRALIATWHHKFKHLGHYDQEAVGRLIDSLSSELPQYALPPASHAHTRHYMPQSGVGKTSLVLDAFAAVDPGERLVATWPSLQLDEDQLDLLDDLLEMLGYLGRAESWVEAKRIEEEELGTAPGTAATCSPGIESVDAETGEILGDTITLYAPLTTSEYQAMRPNFLTDSKSIKKLGPTLPDNLLEALSLQTSDLRKQGWSQPPAAKKVSYLRPINAFRPKRQEHHLSPQGATTARFILIGKPLPKLESSVRVAELFRRALMSRAKHQLGHTGIPPCFSGHAMPTGNRHGHAFYLPWDHNGDGRIDRILVHVPARMNEEERRVLEGLNGRSLRDRKGGEWWLLLENIGSTEDVQGPLVGLSSTWCSVTPYLHPWHRKKKFDIPDQIRRECRERNLPEPISIERLDSIKVGNQRRRPVHFQRTREKRGLSQPDRSGSFWKLVFPKPLNGPLALGFACHYGLGLFSTATKQKQ